MAVDGARPGATRRSRARLVLAAGLLAVMTTACAPFDVWWLARDELGGRNNGTTGSALTQAYLIDRLRPNAAGLDGSAVGDDAFRQPFTGGTNILAVIPGTDLADEYVMVGAHYDHVGSCPTEDPADTICNGATDNAAGVAEVLEIVRRVSSSSTPPRRSLVIAFWDREEDGLLGSAHYVANPLVPLEDTIAYLNFDIQGANLLPSLRRVSFAVGAETGGARLQTLLARASDTGPLAMTPLSAIFGQGRSDYVNLIGAGVPSVFFTDATGPCYHTAQDDIDVVDLPKLGWQSIIATRLTKALLRTENPPPFTSGNPLATYADAVGLDALVTQATADLGRFTPSQQSQILSIQAGLRAIVDAGAAEFGSDDISAVLGYAVTMVNLLTTGDCDGFLPPG